MTILISREPLLFNFLSSRYIMGVDYTFESKVMAVRIWGKIPLFNFERHVISWASIKHSSQKKWPFEFVRASVFSFEHLVISWASIIYSSQKLWPFAFAKSIRVQFRGSRYMMHVNQTSESKVIAI